MNQTEVQWAFRGIETPMGVATYDNVRIKEMEFTFEDSPNMETCFTRLKEDKKFGSANGIQSLIHVLSLEVGNAKEKCDKVVAIFDSLKAQKKKYGSTYELSTLGGLAFTDVESEILAKEIADVDDYVRTLVD